LGRVTNNLNWRAAFAAMLIGSFGLSEDPHHHAVSSPAFRPVVFGVFPALKVNWNLVSAGFVLLVAISFPLAMATG
jgi:hypothetical protein